MIPDLSYDLDGDGIVGQRDFVLAKYFDTNKDGKLSPSERDIALKSIKDQKFEDQFVWGID